MVNNGPSVKPELNFPLYAKAALLLVGLYVLVNMLYVAQDIILPIIYATIVAILISPAVHLLVRKGVNRKLAIGVVMLATFLVITLLIVMLAAEANVLRESWPQLKLKFIELQGQGIKYAAFYLNTSTQKINTWMTGAGNDLLDNSNAAIGVTLTTVGGILATALLTPVYTFMILIYQPHLVTFTHNVFGLNNSLKVGEILAETKIIIQSFLAGLFVEFLILSVLNTAGLMLLGIEYAVLLGIVGALLNAIPYLGGIIGVILFAAVALVTKSPVYVLYVLILYSVIQLIDNNYIVPRVVGSKVKLNALVAIIVVIAGAALWGIPGMFLSIPMTAIIKIIFDRIEPLKIWGFLLGDK